jgi:predicted cupin superfamily sugar epimerase
MAAAAQDIIAKLGLTAHPEGGWYAETWRDAGIGGGRGAGSTILFLLEEGQRSHWHRIDATEIWIFQAGAKIDLRIAAGGQIETHRLGSDVLGGDTLQARVPPGAWQAARAVGGWALVACAVVPAFDFATFELAPPGWEPS